MRSDCNYLCGKGYFIANIGCLHFPVPLQWRLDRGHPLRRSIRFPDDHTFLMICCALGITLCMALSATMFGVVYLNLAILPAYIGILYGTLRSSVYLALYFFFCTALFSVPSGLEHLFLNSGVLLYPLLFGMSGMFKKSAIPGKIFILWGALFPSMLFIVIVPNIQGRNVIDIPPSQAALAGLYGLTALILGALFITYIDKAWDKLQVRVQMQGISEKFQWESEKLQQITNVVPLNIIEFDDNGYVTEVNEYMLSLMQRHCPLLTREFILSRRLVISSAKAWIRLPWTGYRRFCGADSAPIPRSGSIR